MLRQLHHLPIYIYIVYPNRSFAIILHIEEISQTIAFHVMELFLNKKRTVIESTECLLHSGVFI